VKLVLGFGLNDSAQLSFGNFERPTKCIDNVDLDRVFGPRSTHIVKIVCGGYHTMILMDDGTVYGVGENGLGQLGTGDTTQFFKPRRVEGLPLNDPIMDVSCGQNNSYFITCTSIRESIYK
jgi:alpha-tubulin suppressor-like RCC1 family protein